jgi:O-antigen/teichoic acid export membrane protein
MGPFQRILKNLGAMFTGRIISVLQQVIVPAVFTYRYGRAGFGEWMALSGAVAALGTLNFGVQTFMNQDLAIRFNRGEIEGYHIRQSTALRLLCGVVVIAAVLLLVFFLLPFDTLLRLDIPRRAAQLTLYLLALQVLLTILFGYFGGIFMGVNLAHRGANWNNKQALLSATGLLVGVALHAPFPVLAAIQLASLCACTLAVLVDLRRTAPQIFPSLRFWDASIIPEVLKGSGYFGLIEMSTFLVYQAPLMIMLRLIGPVAVADFTYMRTIFSMCRQMLLIFTSAMGAEITTLYGRRDWPMLSRLYNYSERLIFFLLSLVNLTVLMASPVLITLWIHVKPAKGAAHTTVSGLFAVYPYLLASAVSMVVSLKEHKTQFQFSTNTHVEMARMVFTSYIMMVLVSVGAIHVAGGVGFLWTWLAVESLQTAYLVRLNNRLFQHVESLDTAYIVRLVLFCIVGLLAACAALPHTSVLPLWKQSGIALLVAGVVAGIGWQLFRVKEVYTNMRGQFSKRFT